MNGLILAGGTGSRLRPLTLAINKHLLPLHDRPVVYAPLALLIAAGARTITIVVDPRDREAYRRLLGDGSHLGITIILREQERPDGVLAAMAAGLPGRGDGRPWLVALGDCVILDRRLAPWLRSAVTDVPAHSAWALASEVPDGRPYGVVRFDAAGAISELDEKPVAAGSAWALPGIGVFGADLPERLPSARAAGATELPDFYRRFLEVDRLQVERWDPPLDWFDTGTAADLAAAGAAIAADPTQASPELAAQRAGLLDAAALTAAARRCDGSPYADLLRAWAGADHG